MLTLAFLSLISASFADPFIKNYGKTPFGYIHKGMKYAQYTMNRIKNKLNINIECIHEAPPGSEVINNGADGFIIKTPSGIILEHGACKHSMNQTEIRAMLGPEATGSGWQVYTKMDAGDSVNSFLGNWTVPASPSRNGQILYTFTGLQV